MKYSKFNEFLIEIKKNDLRCAIWKNIYDLIDKGIYNTDLDFYVYHEDQKKFLKILSKYITFFAGYEHNIFPGIKHYFFWDEKRFKFIHLNIYYHLYTGHTWVKEYELKLPKSIFEFKSQILVDNVSIPTLSNSHLKQLNEFRIFLKKKGLFNLIYFNHDKNSYQNEIKYFKNISVNKNDYLEIKCNKRLSNGNYLIKLFLGLFKRILKKTKIRKRKLKEGIIIAISGIDGSGKSSIVKNLNEIFETKNILNKIVSPGRIRPIKNKKKLKQVPFLNLDYLKAIIVASIRYYICNIQSYIHKKKGFIVIADRWPGKSRGQMDSPKLASGLLAGLERFIYSKIKIPNIFIFLKVDLKYLLIRNKLRKKIDKESDKEILYRYKKNKNFKINAVTTIIINNEKDIRLTINKILKIISDYLGHSN